MARGTLDHLRRQILRRLELSGGTQAELARAAGHSGPWLSMILRGRRGIQITEIDRIAAFLEVTPAALFEDPDLDPSLLPARDPVEVPSHASSSARTRSATAHSAARLQQLRQIIARHQQTIDRQQRTIDYVLSVLQPAVGALEQLAPMESARSADRGPATRRRTDRSGRDRSAGNGGR